MPTVRRATANGNGLVSAFSPICSRLNLSTWACAVRRAVVEWMIVTVFPAPPLSWRAFAGSAPLIGYSVASR